MEHQFIGWIPCLSGKLFLSHTQCGLGTSEKLAQVNHLDGDVSVPHLAKRYLVISSKVDWKDTHNELLDGRFVVVMLGCAARIDSCVRGTIYLIPAEKISDIHNWAGIYDLIYNIDRVAKTRRPISHLYDALNEKLSAFDDDEFYRVNYILNRSGITYLSYEATKPHENNQLHIVTVTRQSFYYLKYSLHVHKHHHRDDDSITSIHPIPDDEREIGGLLIEDIKRALVNLNRRFSFSDHHALYDAQGVTSYALSLLITCRNQNLMSKSGCEKEKSYFENIRNSLTATAGSVERKLSSKIAASNGARSAILLLISIIAPLTIIHKDKIFNAQVVAGSGGVSQEPSSFLVTILSNIFSSDTKFLFFAATLFAVYWIYQITHSKFGSFIIAIRRYRYGLQRVLGSRAKAKIFAYSSLVFGSLLIIMGWITAMVS
ncbi:MAG: hypothetical protein RPU40_08040 [Candidatus Sedimenticola sp. (ex Thyasira tokunagai)]